LLITIHGTDRALKGKKQLLGEKQRRTSYSESDILCAQLFKTMRIFSEATGLHKGISTRKFHWDIKLLFDSILERNPSSFSKWSFLKKY
jgi:hypothetical protein